MSFSTTESAIVKILKKNSVNVFKSTSQFVVWTTKPTEIFATCSVVTWTCNTKDLVWNSQNNVPKKNALKNMTLFVVKKV